MLIILLCIALGFIVSVFGSGRYAVAAAAWIAPVLFLHAVDIGGGPALGGVWLAIFAAMLVGYRGVIPAPRAIYPAIIAEMATAAVLPYLAHSILQSSVPGFAATLVFPLAWTTIEFLNSRLHPYGSWGSLAYTQYGNLALMQLASVTGIFGIAFLVSWSSAVGAWLWITAEPLKQSSPGPLIFAGVWLAVLLFGGARLLRATGNAVRVAAIGWPEGILAREKLMASLSTELDEPAIENLRSEFSRVNDALLAASKIEAASGAQILVWPEACAPVFAEGEEELLRKCQGFAADAKAHLLIGLARIERRAVKPFQNRAILFAPSGAILFDYAKRIPVPGFEARVSAPGSKHLPAVETKLGCVSAAICFDLDFPHFIRAVGKANADLLLVPASDWREIGHIHLVHAIYRAIETGTSLLRATRWGHSAALDTCGRVTGFMDHYAIGERRMPALLPICGVRTVYSRTGDLFAWSCVAGLIFMAGYFGA